MLSKPTFEVDLIKPGGKTLSFTCSYVQDEEHPEGQEPDEEGEKTKHACKTKIGLDVSPAEVTNSSVVFQMCLQLTR